MCYRASVTWCSRGLRFNVAFQSAQKSGVGPAANLWTAEFSIVRTKDVGVGSYAEQLRFRPRALREPPAVLHIDHAGIKGRREVDTETDCPLRRGHPDPAAPAES